MIIGIIHKIVDLKQLVLFNSSTDKGVEADITLYDGVDSTATDERFKVCLPRQIDSGFINNLIDQIIGDDPPSTLQVFDYPILCLNKVIQVFNQLVIGKCSIDTGPNPTDTPVGKNALGYCQHGATPGPPDALALNLNGILWWLGNNLKIETPRYSSGGGDSLWWDLGIGSVTLFDYTAAITALGWIPHFGFIVHDNDSEMSYNRNASKVFDFPEPGLYFPTGIVAKSLKAETSDAVGAATYVTAVYQQSASHHQGGTVKAVYEQGTTSASGYPKELVHGACIVDSVHIFNDDNDEQGIELYNGDELICNLYAGDNSLTSVYIPKPGFVFNDSLKFDQTSYNQNIATTIVYREVVR